MKKVPKKEQIKRQKRTQKRADYTKARAGKRMSAPKLAPKNDNIVPV